jgi:hypothetical protein
MEVSAWDRTSNWNRNSRKEEETEKEKESLAARRNVRWMIPFEISIFFCCFVLRSLCLVCIPYRCYRFVLFFLAVYCTAALSIYPVFFCMDDHLLCRCWGVAPVSSEDLYISNLHILRSSHLCSGGFEVRLERM